ncbi:MAG: 1-phosphofructokinase family hexose kinase, partial [Candidatus Omnitrophica bacterium]|nr:1-phosphofructokinase family hexose kinase [Candidatus Omnitrophota bacterium]
MIVTLTINPCIDTSTSTGSVTAEHKLRCKQPVHEPGGGGINVSRVIQRLGGKTTALYPSGGPNGKHLEMLIENEHLDHLPISIEGLTRENLTVYEESSGQQYRFTFPGASLKVQELESVFGQIEKIKPHPDYIVASGSLPPDMTDDFYARLSKQVSDWNSRLIVDTSGQALLKAVEKGCYLIKPNMKEMSTLAQKEIENENEIESVATKII